MLVYGVERNMELLMFFERKLETLKLHLLNNIAYTFKDFQNYRFPGFLSLCSESL